MNNTAFPEQLFVTGTDTGIGKTVVSALLTLGLKGTYWKPVQSGLKEETDTEFVERVTGLSGPHILDERYRLTEPMSPHASAAIDGIQIGLEDFEIPDVETEHLVVEGAGGLLVPLNEREMIIDLIDHFGIPVLLVTRSELGTLNHTFLSLEALERRGIDIFGIVMNGPVHESNRETIRHFSDAPLLAEITTIDTFSPDRLKQVFDQSFPGTGR